MKKIRPFLFKGKRKYIFAAVVILLVTAFFLRPKEGPKIETYKTKPEHFVKTISVSGAVNAGNSADLTFQAGGKLVYLGAKKGEYVTKGQTIAVLDQRTALKNLQAALIDYSKQRNDFDQLKSDNQNRTPNQALNDDMKRILENNQYDLNKAVNSVELLELSRQNLVVTTPISGILTYSDINNAGVNVGVTTKFTVTDPTSLIFQIDVDEADVSQITEGLSVNITLNAFPENPFYANITSIDFTTHTTETGGSAYTVEADISDLNLPFRVGMEGNADIIVNEKINVITVPISSINEDSTVFVKVKDKYEKKKVEVGDENDLNVEITSGLSEGEEVVIDPTLVPDQSKKRFFGLF